MKKVNKMITVILTVMMMFTFFSTTVFGAKVNINNINSNQNIDGETDIATIGSYIYSAITSLGIVLSVIILAILGVKYMLGSVDERASYKKSMMPYLIGAVLVFSASTIATVIYNLAK